MAHNSGKRFGKVTLAFLGVGVCAQDVNFTPAGGQQSAGYFGECCFGVVAKCTQSMGAPPENFGGGTFLGVKM